MNEYMPYIVSVVVSIISGALAYFTAAKKCNSDIKTLKQNNEHEINRLMQQHKLDIDSLERKHEMDKEKLEMEHKHQLENQAVQAMISEVVKDPKSKQEFMRGIRQGGNK